MSSIWVRVKRTGTEGRIIGFCPDKKGRPSAIILVRDKVLAYKLSEFKIIDPATRLKLVS